MKKEEYSGIYKV